MKPLADIVRPKSIDDFIGQSHLVGDGKPISRAIKADQIHSMIFWGPPGSGKTTLARIIANEISAQFHYLSAVAAGKADVKKIIEQALTDQEKLNLDNSHTHLLFLDEIHRFNKAQQDYLLPYVENGTLILIGATTENPSFSVINALLSRCQVFVLNQHNEAELKDILTRGYQFLIDNSPILSSIKNKTKKHPKKLSQESIDYLISFANGDARKALNLLENTFSLYGRVDTKNLKSALQSQHLRYDKNGEEHYDTISAFIKSMRASSPNAALYYLSRMVEAGEDPLFIARRMVIFASEDVGMAQPTALVVANSVFQACQTIGYPECAINLAHGVVYLSQAKKDRRAYDGLRAAQADIKTHGNLPIPMNLRNAPTNLMKDLGYGQGYEKYTKKDLLPEKLKGKKYFD